MQIRIVGENTAFPFLIIEDFYTPEELARVWHEIDHIHSSHWHSVDNDTTGNRSVVNGQTLATSDRVYMDDVYRNKRDSSTVLSTLGRVGHPTVLEAYEKYVPPGRSLKFTNSDRTILARYTNTQAYQEHIDIYLHSQILFLHREPKQFTGGDLYFRDSNSLVECRSNTCVLFPSYYYHRVDPVQCNTLRDSRYSITRFYYSV